MADQLLSQSDVDALIASLTKSEAQAPVANKTVPVTPGPKPVNPQAIRTQSVPNVQSIPPKPATVTRPDPIRTIAHARSEPKLNISPDYNILNTKVTDLSKQLSQMGEAVNRLRNLEKRISDIESQLARGKESSDIKQKVNNLEAELQQISLNLKGTPAYGVHNSFTCEKCDDHGHIATLFRCTNCGHERWYGWWPKK